MTTMIILAMEGEWIFDSYTNERQHESIYYTTDFTLYDRYLRKVLKRAKCISSIDKEQKYLKNNIENEYKIENQTHLFELFLLCKFDGSRIEFNKAKLFSKSTSVSEIWQSGNSSVELWNKRD